MRFSLAAWLLLSSTATPTRVVAAKELSEEFPEKELHQHRSLHKIKNSRQRANRGQYRRRERRAAAYDGLLQNHDLPEYPMECSLLLQEQSSEEADVGILSSCPSNTICVAHPESSQGGFCQHRTLQGDLGTADFCRSEGRFVTLPVDEACDCSSFNSTSQQGSFACLVYAPGHCFQENVCGSLTIKHTFDDYQNTEYCYDFEVPFSTTVCYHYTVSMEDPGGLRSCSIKVDELTCNSCRVIEGSGCLELDCSNTAAGVSGEDCSGALVVDGVFRDFVPATASPPDVPTALPTSRPSTTIGDSATTSPPTPNPTGMASTNAPTVTSPSTANPPTDAPKYSLTMPPAMSFPRFSLTAPPSKNSTSAPTPSAPTPSITPSDQSNPPAPSTSAPTRMPTTAPTVSNGTRGPTGVSSINGDGSTRADSAAQSYRWDTVVTLGSLVLVTLTSLVIS